MHGRRERGEREIAPFPWKMKKKLGGETDKKENAIEIDKIYKEIY